MITTQPLIPEAHASLLGALAKFAEGLAKKRFERGSRTMPYVVMTTAQAKARAAAMRDLDEAARLRAEAADCRAQAARIGGKS